MFAVCDRDVPERDRVECVCCVSSRRVRGCDGCAFVQAVSGGDPLGRDGSDIGVGVRRVSTRDVRELGRVRDVCGVSERDVAVALGIVGV